MSLKRIHVLLCSLITLLLVALYPLTKIVLQIKNIQNLYLSFGVIFYLVFMIIMFIIDVVLVIYFIKYIIKIDIPKKALWIILILLFNIFIIPYFYIKYIEKSEKVLFNTIIYALPLFLYLVCFEYGFYVYSDLYAKKIEKQKIIDSTKLEYLTKDNKTSFTFGYGYKQKEVGEYDLYVINKDKSIVFSVFTYNTIDYEQKTVDEFLNKGIEDLRVGKDEFKLFSKKKEVKEDGFNLTTVSYEGKAEVQVGNKVSKSDCIYKLSIITFDSDPNYIVYVIEVVTKANYEDYKTELDTLLKSVILKN